MVEAQKTALVAQLQLLSDIREVEAANVAIHEANGRVVRVLGQLTGQDFQEDREKWRAWWVDYQGYAYTPSGPRPKPTFYEDVPLAYEPQTVPVTMSQQPIASSDSVRVGHSCFGAGTPVRTLSGPRPIETLRVGDQILTRDATTGALSYQPIVAVYHNRPSPTLTIRAGDETIVATGIHRLWKAGHGWTMARELKPGGTLRTVSGLVTVESVEPAAVQPVFNLEVASGQSFFVGISGVLAHDNSLVTPVSHPFDALPSLAAVASQRPADGSELSHSPGRETR